MALSSGVWDSPVAARAVIWSLVMRAHYPPHWTPDTWRGIISTKVPPDDKSPRGSLLKYGVVGGVAFSRTRRPSIVVCRSVSEDVELALHRRFDSIIVIGVSTFIPPKDRPAAVVRNL